MTATDEVADLKEKGNACFKENKYAESLLHYSQAIKLDPQNSTLRSNRSLAFLKLSQYYQAYEDAIETIRLKPTWAKGYYRKGEVELATYHYNDALISYRCALELQPDDSIIKEAISKATILINNEKKANDQVPWLGAGVGIILGVIIVLADQLTKDPTISHPLIMAVLTIAVASIGYAIARSFRYYIKCQREGLLDPPMDLFDEMHKQNESGTAGGEDKPNSGHQRISKAQARLKLRKGKI